ncbi:hypothetical protein ACRS8U_18035 [Klebsiella pneumoniae]|uniref:hypothetical protein n=1 Tax=Klebsiella pneumoniae TaxID=573 RepID=UPI003EE3AE0D
MAHIIPKPSGVKSSATSIKPANSTRFHKVIAIDYLPPSGGCAVITVLIINNQDL